MNGFTLYMATLYPVSTVFSRIKIEMFYMAFLKDGHNDGDEVGRGGECGGALLQSSKDLLAPAKPFILQSNHNVVKTKSNSTGLSLF